MSEPLLNVVLVEPEIPPNTGNIGRLCAAVDCRLHLVEPLGFVIDDKSLQRAGMDYWQHLQWRAWPSLKALQEAHTEARYFYFTTKTRRLYTEVAYQPGDFLVFGRETKGITGKSAGGPSPVVRDPAHHQPENSQSQSGHRRGDRRVRGVASDRALTTPQEACQTLFFRASQSS